MDRMFSCWLMLALATLVLIQISIAKPRSVEGNRRNTFIRDVNKRSNSDTLASSAAAAESVQQFTEPFEVDNGAPKESAHRIWLELEGIPPTRASVKKFGDIVLECQAVGSPPPMIYWRKNGLPIENALSIESEEYANRVDSSSSGMTLFGLERSGNYAMAKVKSKLPLYCVGPEAEAEYSCVAENDGRQIRASTNLVLEENGIESEARDECQYRNTIFHPKKGRRPQPAYIHAAEVLHMENIGSDVILPCRVGGKPRPKVIWIDSDGQMISKSENKKFMIHSNGDLVIRNLSWNDMGEFTCIVTNSLGSDVSATFLYPLLSDEE